jgi:hypothetical protein
MIFNLRHYTSGAGDWAHVDPEYLYLSIEKKLDYLETFERDEVRAAMELAFYAHDGRVAPLFPWVWGLGFGAGRAGYDGVRRLGRASLPLRVSFTLFSLCCRQHD